MAHSCCVLGLTCSDRICCDARSPTPWWVVAHSRLSKKGANVGRRTTAFCGELLQLEEGVLDEIDCNTFLILRTRLIMDFGLG